MSSTADDPCAYTRVELRNEDRLLAIFDREAGGYPPLARSVLEHVAGNAAYENGKYSRDLLKDLTLVLGFRDLGLTSQSELNELIEEVRPTYETEIHDASANVA